MAGAIRFLVNCSVLNASSTRLPLIRSSTSRAFCGETLVNCAFAFNSKGKTMEVKAKAQFTGVSPQKARLVLDLIKGKRVEDALSTLQFTKKRIEPAIFQLVRSAVENANYLSGEKGLDVDVDQLYVKTAIANDGPRMKRIRPAPMGRA